MIKTTPLLAGALCAFTMAGSSLAYAQEKLFEGVTVNVMTRPGEVIARRLAERGVEFEAMTGAKIVVNEVPFAELFQKVQTDLASNQTPVFSGAAKAGAPNKVCMGSVPLRPRPLLSKRQLKLARFASEKFMVSSPAVLATALLVAGFQV